MSSVHRTTGVAVAKRGLPVRADPWQDRRMTAPHEYERLDPTVRRELADDVAPGALLYLPPRGDPDVVVLAMHPRADFSRHYLACRLAAAGYAFAGVPTRYLNNDADALHERLVLDVGAVIARLRPRFARVVLLGNSGGGSLFAFYLAQAATAPAARLARAPSGDRIPLGTAELPAADGLVLLAAHLGEGVFMLDRLDPSVVDEADPIAVNPRLDMYEPANGYRPMAEGESRYTADFVAELRAGQRARCERIDRAALAACESAAYFRARLGVPAEGATPRERALVTRLALQRRYLLTYRTLADPRYLDLRLDPSERPLGSIFSFGRDPVVGNYGEGIGRVMSARGWLSTWSGLQSNAALERTLPGVAVPTLVVGARADTDIYPSETRRAFEASAAADKTFAEVAGADHYLRPAGPTNPRDRVVDEWLAPWLRERWPVARA
jgi:pimeloyl-ACP methyl ester carboxylesterase